MYGTNDISEFEYIEKEKCVYCGEGVRWVRTKAGFVPMDDDMVVHKCSNRKDDE